MNKAKYFIKDYRVPISATVVFVLVLLALLSLRAYDRSVIAEVLLGKGSAGKDYATLLSKDKTDGFNKIDHTAEKQADSTTSGSTKATQQPSTSFTITGTGESTPTAPSGSAPPDTTTPPPASGGSPPASSFSVNVTGIRHEGVSPVECNSTVPYPSQCVRRYFFTAGVEATDGPGIVDYQWDISVPGSSSDSFSAGAGQTLTLLKKVVVISCSTLPGPFTIHLSVTSPNQSNSSDLEVVHDCAA